MTQRPKTFCVLSQGNGEEQSKGSCQYDVFDKRYVLFVSIPIPFFNQGKLRSLLSESRDFGVSLVLRRANFNEILFPVFFFE